MKHRSRVEREEHEEKDKQRIRAEMDKANQRIKMLERDLLKIERRKLDSVGDDDSDDDDDDLDDTEAIKIELEELQQQNAQRQAKLDEYEKNKKWNVDNMFHVKEERTEVNKEAAKANYTEAGYAKSTVDGKEAKAEFEKALEKTKGDDAKQKTETASSPSAKPAATSKPEATKAPPPPATAKPAAGPAKPKPTAKDAPAGKSTDPKEVDSDPDFVYTYHGFTEKYADLCEEFMALKTFDESKEFLLKHGDILLQEHAANYLLLATLEDEMNGLHDEMKQRAKQSQIVTNIAELAKTWNTHPGNVIVPFFGRMQQREFLEGFLAGVKVFEEKIRVRAVAKRKEMDAMRQAEASGQRIEKEGVDLSEIPKEQRLGPGGLDPLEVIETLPKEMQDAFESRDVEQLKQALMNMDPKDAEYHMNRCVASGLWQAQA